MFFKIKFAAAGLLVLAVLGAAVSAPFLTQSRLQRGLQVDPDTSTETCWGCAPYENLIRLFELQETAARPLVRQLRERLRGRNLAASLRSEANAELIAVEARLDAAVGATALLGEARSTCQASETCRIGPQAFQAQTCGGEWPSEDLHEGLTTTADQIFAQGAACRALSCPVMNCEARSRLGGTLDAMIGVLSDMSRSNSGEPSNNETYLRYLAVVQEHLERLPLLLSDPTKVALHQWADDLLNLAAGEIERDDQQDAHWRRRLAAHQVQQLGDLAAPNESEAPDWLALARGAGEVLAQIHYLEWREGGGADLAQCNTIRQDLVAELASTLRRASAALAVCGARVGCEVEDENSILAALNARGAASIGTAAEFIREGHRLLVVNLADLDMQDDDPVTLTADLPSYGAGEAIRVRLGESRNRCIAEEGAWLGFFAPAPPTDTTNDDALATRYLNSRAVSEGVFFEAPEEPGDYQVRAYAPQARGGAELAQLDVMVGEGLGSCRGFSGVWDTNFGELRLYVREDQARGSYRRTDDVPPGFLTGEVQGRVLYGTWDSEIGYGGARLVLSSDGTFFRGSWSHIPGQFTGTGSWTGRCAFNPAP